MTTTYEERVDALARTVSNWGRWGPDDELGTLNLIDGEKRLNGHGRLLVRSSGTEPVIRVMAEGEDRILVEDVVDTIVSALGQAAA